MYTNYFEIEINPGSHKRIMMVGAIDQDGWVPDSGVAWAVDEAILSADPHVNMTSSKFEVYLEMLCNLPAVKKGAIIVLDNARYHRTMVS